MKNETKLENETGYAETLNACLRNGGTVMVSTPERSTQYEAKHAGMFRMRGNNLYVQHGEKSLCLSFGEKMLVSIKMYA